MHRLFVPVTALCAIVIFVGAVSGDKGAEKPADTIEGVLRVHPKFHYRYYIDGFGAGQSCALLGADKSLQQIEKGTRIRVQGDLASKYFGNPNDKTAALVSTWIIYMNVAEVEVAR